MEIKVEFKDMDKAMEKLARLNSAALPIAVRSTLNALAFNTKKKIPEIAAKKFVTRNKTLFKSHTGVNKASGRQMSTLKSSVGLLANKKISDGLSTQEKGGIIKERNYIQLNSARISKNNARRVKRMNYLSNIKFGPNFFLINGKKGNKLLMSRTGKRKVTPIYTYKKNRNVRVKKNNYIQDSAEVELKKTNAIFMKEAEKQINRVIR